MLNVNILILKEFYTNGKRGKIYNKLANLKRHAKDILKPDECSVDNSVALGKTNKHINNVNFAPCE